MQLLLYISYDKNNLYKFVTSKGFLYQLQLRSQHEYTIIAEILTKSAVPFLRTSQSTSFYTHFCDNSQ